MKALQRLALIGWIAVALLSGGCTTALVVAHVHRELTEGDPTPCVLLNSVERALKARCGAFEQGSLHAADVARSGLPVCPLTLAARDPRLWPVLPELLAKGASPESCDEAPLAALAAAEPCPDFAAASPEALGALRWLAEADARAVQHDVVRMLSCPSARVARLDGVLDQWLEQGLLPADGSLGFAPLGALDPSALATPLATRLEAAGHRAEASLGGYAGRLAPGFDEALRRGDWVALDWWLARVPGLVDGVPPTRPNQLPWLPLAQVLTPGYLAAPAQQPDLVRYLLAHGADPWRALPHDPARSVVAYAQSLGSPLAPMLASAHPAGTYAARSAPIARLTPVALRLAQ